jgi:hypothetical protein
MDLMDLYLLGLKMWWLDLKNLTIKIVRTLLGRKENPDAQKHD